jgi:hypothetical protein
MSCRTPSRELFQEAIDHCRWKTALQTVLPRIHVSTYTNKTFEEVFTDIHRLSKDIKGIGLLTIYDLTAAILRYHNKHIQRVYIIGDGPKRAVQLLGLTTKTQTLGKDIKLKYVEIQEILTAFDAKGYTLDQSLRSTTNGDILETYICNWQKTQPN